MNGSHGKATDHGVGRCSLSKYAIIVVALAAAIACCIVLLTALSGCGGDMLATTTQARGSSQAASASASDGAASSAAASEGAAPADAIHVNLEIDCTNAHAYNSKFPETLGTFDLDLPKDATVLDALAATHVDYGMRGKDYVESIGGIADRVCGRDSGWLYLVDGTRPLKTANDYKLSGGETVKWVYTVTEGDVSWEGSD